MSVPAIPQTQLAQAARRVETSTVQLTAATLRLHLAATAPTDGLLAIKVVPFFKSKLLPFQLRCIGVTEVELREELEDGIEYKRSDQGKLAIEEKRVHLLAMGCAAPPLARRPFSASAPVPRQLGSFPSAFGLGPIWSSMVC